MLDESRQVERSRGITSDGVRDSNIKAKAVTIKAKDLLIKDKARDIQRKPVQSVQMFCKLIYIFVKEYDWMTQQLLIQYHIKWFCE